MKRVLTRLAIGLAALLTLAAAPAVDPASPNAAGASAAGATSRGYLKQGGTDIGHHFGGGGKALGGGAAGFGRNLAQGQFGAAGSSLGRGAGGFGQGVGAGTARGFKNFGLAFRNLGRKFDRFASEEN